MKRWFPWIVAAIVVTLLAVLFGYQGYFQSLHDDKDPISLQESITWQMQWWYIWLCLAPLILLLAKKFPVARPGGPRNLAIHIPAAVGLSLAHTTTQTFLNWCVATVAGKGEAFWGLVMKIGISEQLQLGFFFYSVIVAIASALNYYRIYEQEELKASILEAEVSQTQFQAMKMQVYPHFLFNTLTEITRLMKEDVDEADRMIARLGDFLRLSMENLGTQVVALQRELNFLKCYLEIERIRTQNRLSFDLDVDLDSMDAQVPNLLLQPLIESAVTQMRDLPAHVQISARRENGHLRVQITDNCRDYLSGAESEPLTEMRDRLRQIYGEAFYLDTARSPDGRNAVTLEIPV
ncbi:histidine kinase [bacterium]|nr:histidine kinase [bacterium]MCI0606059.1 histidine kinase [bacterium]